MVIVREAVVYTRVEKHNEGQVCSIQKHYRSGGQECQKPPIVLTTQAIVDPNAVVVCARDARSTYAAVFAARRLRESTSPTKNVGVEKYAVVRVSGDLRAMVGMGDDGIRQSPRR